MDNNNWLQELQFFIYCRKSSEDEDRQILSLPAQVKILSELAQKENFHVVAVYQESKSAHKAGRPMFNEVIRRIEKGEGNALLVWDESRIARNALDSGRVIYMIDEEKIKAIVKP